MVKHFTRENLSWTSQHKYPECSFKGSDTRLLLLFLINFLEGPDIALDDVMADAFLCAKSIQDFLSLVFSVRNPFLDRADALESLALLNLWSEKYYHCARKCYDRGLCFFSLTPKYHYLMHVAFDVQKQLGVFDSSGLNRILNPALFSTQMAEDHVGRSSRLARSVHPATTSKRSAQKWLIQTKLLWEKQRRNKSGIVNDVCVQLVCVCVN